MLFSKKLKPKTLNEQELKALFLALEILNKWSSELGERIHLEIERFDVPTRWVEDKRVIVSGRVRISRWSNGNYGGDGHWSEVPEMVRFNFATLPYPLTSKHWKHRDEDQTYFRLKHEESGVDGIFYEYSAVYTHIGLRHDANRLNETIKSYLGRDKKKKKK